MNKIIVSTLLMITLVSGSEKELKTTSQEDSELIKKYELLDEKNWYLSK